MVQGGGRAQRARQARRAGVASVGARNPYGPRRRPSTKSPTSPPSRCGFSWGTKSLWPKEEAEHKEPDKPAEPVWLQLGHEIPMAQGGGRAQRARQARRAGVASVGARNPYGPRRRPSTKSPTSPPSRCGFSWGTKSLWPKEEAEHKEPDKPAEPVWLQLGHEIPMAQGGGRAQRARQARRAGVASVGARNPYGPRRRPSTKSPTSPPSRCGFSWGTKSLWPKEEAEHKEPDKPAEPVWLQLGHEIPMAQGGGRAQRARQARRAGVASVGARNPYGPRRRPSTKSPTSPPSRCGFSWGTKSLWPKEEAEHKEPDKPAEPVWLQLGHEIPMAQGGGRAQRARQARRAGVWLWRRNLL